MKILAYLTQECQNKVNDASLIAIMMKSIHSIFYSSYRKAGLVLAFLLIRTIKLCYRSTLITRSYQEYVYQSLKLSYYNILQLSHCLT